MAIGEHGELLVSPPSHDPLDDAGHVPDGVTPALYQVPSSGLDRANHDRAMEETERVVRLGSTTVCGAMGNRSCEIPTLLRSPLGSITMNSGGDPFVGTCFPHQLKWMERNVLDYYASLWNAKWPHRLGNESYWGYILTMGSTEGNLHALWSARNYLSGFFKKGQMSTHSKVPVAFFSQNSNCSLYKCCDIVNVATFDSIGRALYPKENPLGGEWLPGVPCRKGGTIDIDALEVLVDFFSYQGHPIIVLFSYGTTFMCGCDDIENAGKKLVAVLTKNNMYECKIVNSEDPSKHSVRQGFWFHVDGAIAASYMPFLEMAYKKRLSDIKPASVFDFRLDFITSIVTSGHKYIGLPWPTGVYIVKNTERVSGWDFPYYSSCDRTISLSRSGHSIALFWSYISSNSYDTQVNNILKCLEVVVYVVSQLHKLQQKISIDLWIAHTLPSLSVAFRRPNLSIVRKHTLSIGTVKVDSEVRLLAQVHAAPHLSKERVDGLIMQLEETGAFEQIMQ